MKCLLIISLLTYMVSVFSPKFIVSSSKTPTVVLLNTCYQYKYHDGYKSGEWICYDGDEWVYSFYREGKLEGVQLRSKSKDLSTGITESQSYSKGKRDGLLVVYHSDGTPSETYIYDDDTLISRTLYDSIGRVVEKGSFGVVLKKPTLTLYDPETLQPTTTRLDTMREQVIRVGLWTYYRYDTFAVSTTLYSDTGEVIED